MHSAVQPASACSAAQHPQVGHARRDVGGEVQDVVRQGDERPGLLLLAPRLAVGGAAATTRRRHQAPEALVLDRVHEGARVAELLRVIQQNTGALRVRCCVQQPR